MEKHDLLIHYDEDRREFVFHPVPTKETADLRANSFDGVRPEISYFKELSPDEAEQALGRLVFSLMDLNSLEKVGIRDYEAEAEAAHRVYVAELEKQVKIGDPEAMFHLSQAIHEAAMKQCSLQHLHRAESLLTAAAHAGYEGAKERLEKTWPMLKAATERRIARGNAV